METGLGEAIGCGEQEALQMHAQRVLEGWGSNTESFVTEEVESAVGN